MESETVTKEVQPAEDTVIDIEPDNAPANDLHGRISTAESQLQDLDTRVEQLEAKPEDQPDAPVEDDLPEDYVRPENLYLLM